MKIRQRGQKSWSLCGQKRKHGPNKTLTSDVGFQDCGRTVPALTFPVTWHAPGVRTNINSGRTQDSRGERLYRQMCMGNGGRMTVYP